MSKKEVVQVRAIAWGKEEQTEEYYVIWICPNCKRWKVKYYPLPFVQSEIGYVPVFCPTCSERVNIKGWWGEFWYK